MAAGHCHRTQRCISFFNTPLALSFTGSAHHKKQKLVFAFFFLYMLAPCLALVAARAVLGVRDDVLPPPPVRRARCAAPTRGAPCVAPIPTPRKRPGPPFHPPWGQHFKIRVEQRVLPRLCSAPLFSNATPQHISYGFVFWFVFRSRILLFTSVLLLSLFCLVPQEHLHLSAHSSWRAHAARNITATTLAPSTSQRCSAAPHAGAWFAPCPVHSELVSNALAPSSAARQPSLCPGGRATPLIVSLTIQRLSSAPALPIISCGSYDGAAAPCKSRDPRSQRAHAGNRQGLGVPPFALSNRGALFSTCNCFVVTGTAQQVHQFSARLTRGVGRRDALDRVDINK